MEQAERNLKRIEQVDQIARETLAKHHLKMPEKYANIQATLKLLSNLIANFRRRADTYELELKSRAKITDLLEQIQFHKTRIADCERMSEALSSKVQQKRAVIAEGEIRVNELRKQMLKLKTNNVKKVLLLENLEAKRKCEKDRESNETRKATWKMKTEYSRACHTNYSAMEDELRAEKSKTVKMLYSALGRKKASEQLIVQAWQLMKSRLCKQERKASSSGLNGSLMFRILENDHSRPPKVLKDAKLMIYDVLKSKHQAHLKDQQRQNTMVTEEEFMAYSPLQLFGIIELKGGLSKLIEAITQYEGQHGRHPASTA
jgi:hypothetical protein